MIHLIQGDDEYRVSLKREEIISAFSKGKDPDIERYSGKDSSFDLVALFNAASTLSFFSPQKIIIVESAYDLYSREKTLLAKKGSNLFEDILNTGDDVLMVLTTHEKTIPSNASFYKILSKKGKIHEIKKLWHDPNEGLKGDLLSFVANEVKKRNLNLDRRQTEVIVTRVGSDLRQIANELDKIAMYLGEETDATLDSKTLVKLIPPSRELVVFNLIDAIASKNRPKALSYLADLISSGANGIFIVTMIHRQFRQIFHFQILKKNDVREEDIVREIGLTKYTLGKVKSQSRNFPSGVLPDCINALIKADEEIKTSAIKEDLILEKLIIKLTG